MPLAPFHAFIGVKPADVGGFLHRLHGLGIYYGSARMRLPTHAPSFRRVERRVQPSPSSAQAQAAKVIKGGLVTNDKLCLTRQCQLTLKQPRSSPVPCSLLPLPAAAACGRCPH